MNKNVSVIVVTYNRLNLLKECLTHLLNQSYKIDKIFVVNNNSSDGTKKYLDELDNSTVSPINTKRNLGGAGGFSLGTQIAFQESSSQYFWLMDDDTMPTKDALLNLMNSATELHNNFGYLCSNVRWWKDNKPSYLNVPIASRDWNDKLNSGLVKTISASFVSLFVPRNMVKQFGYPIGQMFIWGDDVEYTTRLSKHMPSYLVNNSIVLHKSKTNSTTESVFNVPMNRLIYYKCMFRNHLYISRKYYNFRRIIKLLLIYSLSLIKIPFYANDHKLKRFNYTLEGIVNGFFFNPKIRIPKK